MMDPPKYSSPRGSVSNGDNEPLIYPDPPPPYPGDKETDRNQRAEPFSSCTYVFINDLKT